MTELTSLEVFVKSAQNIPNVDRPGGNSDPFVAITFQGQKKQTKWLEDQPNPEWNESLIWELRGPLESTEQLKVTVLDHERFGWPQFIGETEVSLSEVVQSGTSIVETPLKDKSGNFIPDALLTMEIRYHGHQTGEEGVSDDEADNKARMLQRRRSTKKRTVRKKLKIVVPSGSTSDVESEVDTEDLAEGTGNPFKIADMAEFENSEMRRSAARANLPDKPTDFQIRVHIIEGRKLEGEFLKAMVKVFIAGQTKETPVRQGTNNPYWNETMIFNFKEHPDLMMDKVVEIRVLNTRKLLKDALIGSFKFDVGLTYNEPERCFIHKWLLLTDPDDSSGGAKGFVKFSINVIGPGDEPKHSPATMSPDNVDIEANVLRQSGTRLQPASLTIRIYRGSDLPQMDPVYFEAVKKLFNSKAKPKNLVDPYCLVSYAGHRGKTPIIWNNQEPRWNHQINLSVRFPLLSERIRIRLKDKDRSTADDIIATTYLKLSQMSSTSGESGFPPTFGPCFVNLYGAPREFNDLRDYYEHLNKGVIEGVSYRGRLMIEIVTEMGKLPAEKHNLIAPNDVTAIEPFLKQHKYKLCAVFLSASIIEPYNHSVEFEVSIGNYGNKLEERLGLQTSTTPSLKPIFDGNKYYFMPWLEKKPVVVVDSEWEDCTYRIETLNLLLGIERELDEGLTKIKKTLLDTSIPVPRVQRTLAGLLTNLSHTMEELIRWLDPNFHANPFPELHTKFDELQRDHRLSEMIMLLKEVNKLLSYHREVMELAELNDMVKECENMLNHIKTLATDPQNSIPDVIIWMLCGDKRVASCRIPSNLLMHSSTNACKGQHCGKIQTIFLQPPTRLNEEENQKTVGRALLQVMLWLGRDGDQRGWTSHIPDGDYSVYAETYENESRLIAGPWSSNLLSGVPHWSDAKGKVSLPQEVFVPPEGWRWDGAWELSPEISIDMDEERTEWKEEIFEMQEREVECAWSEESMWTLHSGDNISVAAMDGAESVAGSVAAPLEDPSQAHRITKEDIECPIGWKWSKPWQVDPSHGDSEGWEYSTSPEGPEWIPSERSNHTSRRRKWVRPRVVVHDPKIQRQKKEQLDQRLREGWEYARKHRAPFHARKSPLDFARHRRYLRKMVANDITMPVVFKFVNSAKGKKKVRTQVPRHYLTFKDYHRYQLRAYLYQARDMYGSDQSGLSDPYCILSLGSKSIRSITLQQTVTPRWEQTLVLQLGIYGNPQHLLHSPPTVTMEFYDSDKLGDEYIGWAYCHPRVRFNERDTPPELEWHEITRHGKPAGEVLAAFELLLDDGTLKMDLPPGTAPKEYALPEFIKPDVKPRRIEFLCWGVREMKRHHLQTVNSPYVELECGGIKVQGPHIEDASKNPNFPGPKSSITLDLEIPVKDIFAPPVNLTVFDRRFNRVSKVAVHSIKTLSVYCMDPTTTEKQRVALAAAGAIKDKKAASNSVAIQMPNFDPDSLKTSEFDWWSKYYCSIDDPIRKQKKYEDEGYDKLVMYENELEKNFNNFEDILKTFPLFRGKGSHDAEEDADQVVGYLKGALKVYPIMDGPSRIFGGLSNEPIQCLVRVYIIRGIDLQPLDPGGKSDPYIRLKIGKTEINDKENYIPNQLNPTFGKVFEIPALIPLDHTLQVTVMDRDLTSADDLIGTTTIDLENRLISQHRATCGLSESYFKRGVCAWRDCEQPSEILENFCRLHNFPEPEWRGERVVVVDGIVYDLSVYERGKALPADLGAEKERIALYALQSQVQEQDKDMLQLVSEHVETRTLYNSAQPGISQGSLHMWVDIFPRQGGTIPPPVNITPRKPEKFFLRIVVWNTMDVELNETSAITGEDMSDIYVKGWLQGQDKTQKTDVHYRSLDGEGNFNWRFVFEFDYLPSEHVMVIKKKEHFYSLDKTESSLPPLITLQVWDNDLISADDFIGTIDMNLHEMPRPSASSSSCTLDLLRVSNPTAETVNLFEQKTIKGFWPVFSNRKEGRELTGKLELEMELVTAEEHEQRPAGKARDEPNTNPVLSPPNRPATSFFWFSSPLKTLRFVVWKQFKWPIIIGAVLVLVGIAVAIFVYTAPGYIMNFIAQNLVPSI